MIDGEREAVGTDIVLVNNNKQREPTLEFQRQLYKWMASLLFLYSHLCSLSQPRLVSCSLYSDQSATSIPLFLSLPLSLSLNRRLLLMSACPTDWFTLNTTLHSTPLHSTSAARFQLWKVTATRVKYQWPPTNYTQSPAEDCASIQKNCYSNRF